MTGPEDKRDISLFSYGTLQDPAVQTANFGRLLEGRPDALPGYKSSIVQITDPEVLAVSGAAWHPIVTATGDPADQVQGTVFRITESELAAADEYEVSDYTRIRVTLLSGTHAWVYVEADQSDE
ncbi:gamma-glutamylcyclotransferase [Planotetraspora phitsanulokensis]|uniref:UDP-N-acetylmuramate--alanine ligase n=1 Tax=Planotetraspora phitsanulokensis TaxID=575192 RepID=A0A8J3U9T2_9ACTN|nr:gamma-glutamylcyclotransferase family protein [Planotetraspora phitsanulokensis]GII41383.1 UDP-N-acetylmuramate--alanine ligase [Planotetraspora phitsanulokensis]